MDSGDQTNMVYDLCQEWADVDVRPTKGEDEVRGAAKVRSSPITKRPKTRRAYKRTMLLYVFDSNFHKDAQARLAAVSDEGPGYLHLPADLPGDWVRQFTAEHKVPDRSRGQRGRSGRPRSVWRIKHEHAANHYWDTAVLNTVAGDDQP